MLLTAFGDSSRVLFRALGGVSGALRVVVGGSWELQVSPILSWKLLLNPLKPPEGLQGALRSHHGAHDGPKKPPTSLQRRLLLISPPQTTLPISNTLVTSS